MYEDQRVERPKFHLGVSDFSKIVKTKAFVDKSLLVRDFLEVDDFILITAPRQFGKSTNMDMLKRFLEIRVDGKGNPVYNVVVDQNGQLKEKPDHELSLNYRLFKDHNLKIYQEKSFFMKHCGQYPVVYVNFSRAIVDGQEAVIDEFRHIVKDAFEEHEYLSCSEHLNSIQVQDFNHYYGDACTLNKAEVISALYVLCKYLYKHFNKNVVVLIDGCDTPLFDGIHRNNDHLVGKTVFFIRKILTQLLKGNSYIDHALINAKSHFVKVLLEDTTNILHYPFLGNHSYARFYGFTNREVKSLLDKFGLVERLKEVKHWYNGYRIVGEPDISIFNPWSVLNFLKFNSAKDYWADLNTIKNLEELLKIPAIQEKVEKLLLGEEVCIYKPESVNIQHIQHLTHLYNKSANNMDNVDTGLFFEFSCDNGYFSIVRTSCTYVVLEIPNFEIESYFKRILHKNVLHKKWGSMERI